MPLNRLATDPVPAAEFLVRHLYRPIEVAAGARFSAVAETENMGDDDWFWNDDNAKVLELMSLPAVWRRFPEETGEILRFVRSMCHGPFIFRRLSGPRLDRLETKDGVTTWCHSLMELQSDLARGAVIAGVRFHDGRHRKNVMLYGHHVAFTYRNRRYREAVPTVGCSDRSERDGHRLRLRHAAEMHFETGWRRRRLGEIVYTYTFDALTMLFEVEAALELDPGIAVSDVVLTIAHSGLAHSLFNNVVAGSPAGASVRVAPETPERRVVAAAGASYYAIRQAHISGDALAIHSMPCGPQPLAGFEIVDDNEKWLDRVLARYEFSGLHRGGRLVAAEHKLITAGGFYDRIADYAAFLGEAAAGERRVAYDYSISYDYGATLNAFAKCFAVAKTGAVEPPLPLDEMKSLADHTLDQYFDLYVDCHDQQPHAVFSRELAFAALGIMTMYRATGDDGYRRRLTRACEVLVELGTRFDRHVGRPMAGFVMRKHDWQAYVDCQSSALLALTLAARHLNETRLADTIDAGLAGYGLETVRREGALLDTVQVLMIGEDGERHTLNAFWNYKAGLTLRFFTALRAAEDPALRAIAARHGERIARMETVLRRQIERSTVEHPDGIELRCSVLSAETNSETQPWTALGLVGHPWD